jgi:hypothetical protein
LSKNSWQNRVQGYIFCMTPANPLQVEITYQQARDILLVRTQGVIDDASMLTLFAVAAAAADKHNCRRFFFDHRASPLDLKTSAILRVPFELERHGLDGHQAALLFNEIGRKEKFFETSCLNRGVNVKVFNDPVEALLWLTSTPGAPPVNNPRVAPRSSPT